jgi:O-acetyl-ADP-ribose deacetylase (regulator of RNase III)
MKSMAFLLISTGVYGFPKDEDLSISIEEIHTFLLEHEDVKVILVVFGRKLFVLSTERFGGLEAYIDEHYVGS